MEYQLASLMTIRERREDVARGELVASRHKVAEAQNELESRLDDLREYERTKDSRRDRIYASIIGRTLSADELALAQEGVSRIDEEGNLKSDNVLRAEDVLKERRKDESLAHGRFVAATKNKMKIEAHHVDWLRIQACESERRQEIELEDFTGKKVSDDRDG